MSSQAARAAASFCNAARRSLGSLLCTVPAEMDRIDIVTIVLAFESVYQQAYNKRTTR